MTADQINVLSHLSMRIGHVAAIASILRKSLLDEPAVQVEHGKALAGIEATLRELEDRLDGVLEDAVAT